MDDSSAYFQCIAFIHVFAGWVTHRHSTHVYNWITIVWIWTTHIFIHAKSNKTLCSISSLILRLRLPKQIDIDYSYRTHHDEYYMIKWENLYKCLRNIQQANIDFNPAGLGCGGVWKRLFVFFLYTKCIYICIYRIPSFIYSITFDECIYILQNIPICN